jgi:hypothetical protein
LRMQVSHLCRPPPWTVVPDGTPVAGILSVDQFGVGPRTRPRSSRRRSLGR